MKQGLLRSLLLVGVVAAVFLAGSEANAGWNHWRGYNAVPYVGWSGYSYSYYGGWGACGLGCYTPTYTACYTPCYTACYDPCYTPGCYVGYRGCGLLSRLAYRRRAHHYNYYWGGYSPFWAGSACCWGCGCATVDCCCGGMESGIQYGAPVIVPDQQGGPTPADPPAADPNMNLPEKQTSFSRDSALLTVAVPSDARVLVNGIPTRSTGSQRRYVSRNLTPGFDYTYEVRAEVMVDGKPVVQTKTAQLRAGQDVKLNFDMNAANPLETALTLRVPTDARVYLAGNETHGIGSVRTFRTSKLAKGETWSNYLVRVEVQQNGERVSKEETITLQAGEQRELTFDFNIDKVAAAR